MAGIRLLVCILVIVGTNAAKALESDVTNYQMNEVWQHLSQCQAVNQQQTETIKNQNRSIQKLEDFITKQATLNQRLEEKQDEIQRKLDDVERKVNRLPDIQYDLNGVGCFMDAIELNCVANGTIAITNAIYGQYADVCSDCCAPQPQDCTVRMSDIQPGQWALLLSVCNGQTTCSYEYTGEVINDCEPGYVADYMQIFYTCPPDDVVINEAIGFTARHSNDTSYSSGEIVIFDDVLTDLGNNYNPSNSTFTCPISGIYAFSVSIVSPAASDVFVAIMLDNVELIDAYADGESDIVATASAMVMAQCDAGQRVYTQASSNGHMDGNSKRPHFTGALIQRLQ